MAQINRGGSIVIFGVVALLLGGLLAGGVYWAKQAAHTASANPQQYPQTPQKPAEKPTQKSTPDSGKKPSQPAPSPQSTPQNTTPAKELPATGASETLVTVIALGFVTAGGLEYLRSRRPALSL